MNNDLHKANSSVYASEQESLRSKYQSGLKTLDQRDLWGISEWP